MIFQMSRLFLNLKVFIWMTLSKLNIMHLSIEIKIGEANYEKMHQKLN